MSKTSRMKKEISKSLLELLAPEVIIDHFELVSIRENSDCFILEFEELAEMIPTELTGCEVKLSGFTNKIELHTFPQKGKSTYLHIKRRKWEDKSTGKSYSNHYDLHKEGMKATDELGDFLKKNDRGRTNKI